MNIAMTPPFSWRWEEVLFWVAVIVGFVVPFIYFVRWSLKNAASTKTKPRKDVSTLTNFALIPTAVFAIWLGYAGVGPLPHWLLYPGLTMFLLGLAVTVWAYHTLGRFFSLEVQVQREHRVVKHRSLSPLASPGLRGSLIRLRWVRPRPSILALTAGTATRNYDRARVPRSDRRKVPGRRAGGRVRPVLGQNQTPPSPRLVKTQECCDRKQDGVPGPNWQRKVEFTCGLRAALGWPGPGFCPRALTVPTSRASVFAGARQAPPQLAPFDGEAAGDWSDHRPPLTDYDAIAPTGSK